MKKIGQKMKKLSNSKELKDLIKAIRISSKGYNVYNNNWSNYQAKSKSAENSKSNLMSAIFRRGKIFKIIKTRKTIFNS